MPGYLPLLGPAVVFGELSPHSERGSLKRTAQEMERGTLKWRLSAPNIVAKWKEKGEFVSADAGVNHTREEREGIIPVTDIGRESSESI